MKKLIILSFFLFNSSIFADSKGVCINCNQKCSDLEVVSLNLLKETSQKFLTSMFLNKSEASKGKGFFNDRNSELTDLFIGRKSISEACLDNACQGADLKTISKKLPNGLELQMSNPLCDYTADNRNMPINFLVISLSHNGNSIAQLSYRNNTESLSIMLKTPTNNCKDNEGGAFNSNFIVSTSSITAVPNEGSIAVKNTPTGAQLIRKKKVIPSMSISEQSGKLSFDLGDNYNAVIDLNSNQMVSNNVLVKDCKGSIGRNPSKGTSRLILPPSAINANGFKVLDTNQYKIIDAETAKVPW